jgi:hypothetical protein
MKLIVNNKNTNYSNEQQIEFLEDGNILQYKQFIPKKIKPLINKYIKNIKEYSNRAINVSMPPNINPEPGASTRHFFWSYTINNDAWSRKTLLESYADGVVMEPDAVSNMIFNKLNLLYSKLCNRDNNINNHRKRYLQYVNECFFGLHRHTREFQAYGLILLLSERGTDYHEGGTRFYSGVDSVDTSEIEEYGDVFAFRYDLLHEVLKTKADNFSIGRVTAILPHIES